MVLAAAVFLFCGSAAAGDEQPDDTQLPLDTADEQQVVDDESLQPPPHEQTSRQRGRVTLQRLTRDQLREEGFVFEDLLTHQRRAHATLFAVIGGAVLPGAGHWHLDDRGGALTLVGVNLTALALLSGGLFLTVRPTDQPLVDERRDDLWYLGSGLLATSWLVDVFGTAYRDDLGIPASTHRQRGWGAQLSYRYWRAGQTSMRHVSTLELTRRSPRLEFHAHTSQELGRGMSDYRLDTRWFPFVATPVGTRAGIGVSGRFTRYQLDEPFRRGEVAARFHTRLNLGQLAGHLDGMLVGFSGGLALRERQFVQEASRRALFRDPGWYLPARLFLALNLAEQLRLRLSYERGTAHWLDADGQALGVPSATLTYRSTDGLDLRFFATFGDGVGAGAGLRMWLGE